MTFENPANKGIETQHSNSADDAQSLSNYVQSLHPETTKYCPQFSGNQFPVFDNTMDPVLNGAYNRAIADVLKTDDAQKWLAGFGMCGISNLGGKPMAEIESHSGTKFEVQLFEQLPDHTASHNFYTVDMTGKIKPYF